MEPIKIYVVHHCTFEDTNVFFVNRELAKAKLIELAKKYDTEVNECIISTIKEGDLFDACFDDLE